MFLINPRLIVLFVTFLSTSWSCTGGVRLTVVDSYGYRILWSDGMRAELVNADGHKMSISEASEVKCGSYSLEIRLKGFREFERKIEIVEHMNQILVGLRVGRISQDSQVTLSGRIPAHLAHCTKGKILAKTTFLDQVGPLFSELQDGLFYFENVEFAEYIFALVDAGPDCKGASFRGRINISGLVLFE